MIHTTSDAETAANIEAIMASRDREWRRCVLAAFAALVEYHKNIIDYELTIAGKRRPPEKSLIVDAELAARDANYSLFIAHLAARGPDALLAYVQGARRLMSDNCLPQLPHESTPPASVAGAGVQIT